MCDICTTKDTNNTKSAKACEEILLPQAHAVTLLIDRKPLLEQGNEILLMGHLKEQYVANEREQIRPRPCRSRAFARPATEVIRERRGCFYDSVPATGGRKEAQPLDLVYVARAYKIRL